MVQGKTGELELNTCRAADGRHPPFITAFTLPASHVAWPEGTLMAEGMEPGTATADVVNDGSNILGVLDTRVEADEQSGNIILHGSCAADVLKWVDGNIMAVNDKHIAALRGVGIYV